jgi:hypothetical protein
MSKRRYRPPTLAELFKRMEGAAIDLRMQNEKFEARRAAYQDGFIPNYVSTAQDYYERCKADYEAALAESEKPK